VKGLGSSRCGRRFYLLTSQDTGLQEVSVLDARTHAITRTWPAPPAATCLAVTRAEHVVLYLQGGPRLYTAFLGRIQVYTGAGELLSQWKTAETPPLYTIRAGLAVNVDTDEVVLYTQNKEEECRVRTYR
jgi:hypothetical protein